MAQSTLPQFASAPNIAALTSEEHITDFAAREASFLVSAPSTTHSRSLVAPSPSPASILHKQMFTVFNAHIKASKSSPSAVISVLPAMPFASTTTMSLVEVSPSTLSILKVSVTSLLNAF